MEAAALVNKAQIPLSYRQVGRNVGALCLTLHIVLIGIWNWPINTRFLESIRRESATYIGTFGLWQWFHMLAEPKVRNFEFTAKITLTDGQSVTWPFPILHKMNPWDRFWNEKQRKWQERLAAKHRFILEDGARFVARKVHRPDQVPQRVEIWMNSAWILEPEKHFVLWGEDLDNKKSEQLIDYQVTPRDLE